jgi:hypothetical protein
MLDASVADVSAALVSRRMLRESGVSERSISESVRAGRLQRVRRGWFSEQDAWNDLSPEARHLAAVVAVTRDGRDRAVVSHESAAVLWGLPLYRHAPARVHLTTPTSFRISSGTDAARHVAPLPAADIVVRQGIRCTSLERTVFDVARTLPLETAVACADAAERTVALRGPRWDEDALAFWRAHLAERMGAAAGARGVRQARRVIEFADGRAQLPGESVSRLQLHRLGFAPPRLQVAVPAQEGGQYFVDFALDDVRAFGEFDGRVKYTDPLMRAGKSLEQVLLAEKQREDWIRGLTQYRFVRWGAEHSATPARLAARLKSFGIIPPR